jgi:hypothetical protein
MEERSVWLDSERLKKVERLLQKLPHGSWQQQFWSNVHGALTRRWRGKIA